MKKIRKRQRGEEKKVRKGGMRGFGKELREGERDRKT